MTKQGADDSLYLVGANFLDYQYELDVIFTKMENDEPTEMQTARSGVGYWGTDTFSCSGPIANLIVAGEGVSSYLFRLDPSGKWNEETKLLDAMRTVGTNNYGDPLSVFSLRTSEDKLAVYLGGYFSASELQAPGETTPSTHRDFIVRCVEDSANPNGYSCEPRFIAMHDGKTDVDPEPTYAPPYGDLLEGVVTGMWGYLDKGVETIQTMSTIGYRTYDGNLGRIVEFSWWLSNASVEGGIWTFDPPNGCIGWQDGPCDTYGSHEVDYQYYSELNRGMYSIDGLNGVVMIAGMPKVPLFDDKKESVVQNPGNAPNVAPLFLKDSGGWSKLLYPPDQLLQDPKHFEGAPYEFLFDHVRFVNEKVVLLVGHYRTCLTDGCYNTSNVENAVTVKAQPFVTTYQLAAKTFGPMIPIGSGFERECCTGTSCQTLPNCLGYNVSAFWRNARPRGVNLRYRSDGVEIYMTLNPPSPSGDNTLPERQPIVYSFISLQP